MRIYATPKEEGFRRLFHKHANAIQGFLRPMLLRPALESCGLVSIEHVVAASALVQNVIWNRGHLTTQSRRSGVDDKVETLLLQVTKSAGLDVTQIGEVVTKPLGTRYSAICDD